MFLPMRAGTMEDRSPYGDFWWEPVSVHTSSGVRVNSDAAMRLSAVYACVQLLAKTFAVAPFRLYKPRSDGGRDEQRRHWLYQLIERRPNRFQNPFKWRQMLMGHLCLRGNAYNRIYANSRGVITDLIPQHPDFIRAELLPMKNGQDTGEWRYKIRHRDGSDEVVPRGQIWHLTGMSADGIAGINPIEYMRETAGMGLAAQDYGARFFANDASPNRGWIKSTGRFKDQEAKKLFMDGWQSAFTGANRHRTPVLEGGMEYHEVGVKNSDAQFIESRKFTISEIARMFGVPPHLIGDLERSTNNNIEQQSLEYLLYTMSPIARSWQSSISYDLCDDEQLEPDFDLEQLIRGDLKTRGEFNQKMFGVGAFSTNDIIKRTGGNPVEGGDQRFIPVNMMPLKPNMQSPSDGQGAADEQTETEGAPEPTGRLQALAQSTVDRIVRKEVEGLRKAIQTHSTAQFYQKHVDFVAAALAVTRELAYQYVAQQLDALGTDEKEDIAQAIEQSARPRLLKLALQGSLI